MDDRLADLNQLLSTLAECADDPSRFAEMDEALQSLRQDAVENTQWLVAEVERLRARVDEVEQAAAAFRWCLEMNGLAVEGFAVPLPKFRGKFVPDGKEDRALEPEKYKEER